MERITTDILVIGAGSGGLSVAAGAAQMGARVVLLEGGEMGGDCLNYGCVPSKALIASAKAAHAQAGAAPYGIAPVTPQVDYAAAMEHVRGVIAAIAPVDSQERFEGLGVRVIRDWGRFVSDREVEAGETRIRARRIVIATGSSPLVPGVPGLDGVPYLTNETLWSLRERPGHLLILGGGPIGMEMAQAHRRLGCEVTVIEGARALGREDPEAAVLVLARLRQEGVRIEEGARVSQVSGGAGEVTIETEGGERITGTHLLVAAGRRSNTERLNLEAAGIETSRTGIKVDDRLRSSNRRVHVIGDAAGGAQFTHLAGYHAGIVIRSMLFGLPARAGTAHIPRATYTDPEIAQVGLTEDEARERHGDRLEIARSDYGHNDRAQADRETAGFIKVMAVRGRPVGVTIAGHQAGEHIAIWSLAISAKLKLSHVSGMVAPYPTYSELGKRAAGAYFSPKLFDNRNVKRVVRAVQRLLP
ncbi:dihydrolipoamide dehydrogenase [Aquicoccus sp. SCR17]|nr:dihydrolipoamide dehydrogenase [Carideicomes alvinocaridis]